MLRTHGLIAGDWRVSIAEGIAGGELYDLKNDPDEFFNRWSDPAGRDAKSDALAELARAEMEAVDELPFPTGRA